MDDFGELLNTARDSGNVARAAVLDESLQIGTVDELQGHEHRLAKIFPALGIMVEESRRSQARQRLIGCRFASESTSGAVITDASQRLDEGCRPEPSVAVAMNEELWPPPNRVEPGSHFASHGLGLHR
jgi:hypothetical protein